MSASAPSKRKKPLSKPRKVGQKKKPTVVPLKGGVRFRSRGPFKCTLNADGKACTGLHKALEDVIGTGFDYAKSKAAGTLRVVPHPVADHFIPAGPTRNQRHLAYSKQQGCKLDQQVGHAVKLMQTMQIPMRAFFDKAHLDQVIRLKFGRVYKDKAVVSKVRRIRTVANTLMPETERLLRYLHSQKLTPFATQVPVASGKVGTQVDLVVTNEAGEYIIVELKNGYEKNYQHGTLPPFMHNWAWTQARHNMFQTMMEKHCFHKTFPDRKLGPARMIRLDSNGLHMYLVPGWMNDFEDALAKRMNC